MQRRRPRVSDSLQAWQLSVKTNLYGCQTEHLQEKRAAIRGTKKMETLVFVSSLLSTRETIGARSHVVMAHLSHINCERHHRLFLSEAGISTERSYFYMLLHHVLTQKKADVLKVCHSSCQPWQNV